MNFDRDTFESIARRKKLAGWLSQQKGPAKKAKPCYPDEYYATRRKEEMARLLQNVMPVRVNSYFDALQMSAADIRGRGLR